MEAGPTVPKASRSRLTLAAAGVWLPLALLVPGCAPAGGRATSAQPRALATRDAALPASAGAARGPAVTRRPAQPARVAGARSPAADSVVLALWPGRAPGEPPGEPPESTIVTTQDARGPITRVVHVSRPTLTLYRPATAGTSTAAVLVFPGGSYQHLAYDIEGTEICGWLNRSGIACVLVKYRVPQPNDSTRYRRPLQDAQRAMGLVREHAADWGIDPHKVGAIGFSAGAHLAAVLSNHFASRGYPAVDAADRESCRPDFALVIYPGWLAGSGGALVRPEVQPTADTPPTFLVQAEDDFARMENSLSYELALKQAGVPAELHIYPKGGHGYGLRPGLNRITAAWPGLALSWLESLGVIDSAAVPRQP